MKNLENLKKIDLNNLWHPFTQTSVWESDNNPLIVESAEGFELIDIEGNRYLDGVSSLWCNVHGHSVPAIITVLKTQADKVCHSTLLGLSHRPILELTERLIKIVPKNLTRVFYADSGSTAVEASLRMAMEWWQKQNTSASKKKTKLLSLVGAYHGDTLGAVSVGYLESFHWPLKSLVAEVLRVNPPHVYRFEENLSEEEAVAKSIEELSSLLEKEAEGIAAFIIEPLVQGAAGMWIHSEKYLQAVSELCTKHNVLLIADEVATGFGKTGKMFAVEKANVEPDILVLGKGLSAGYLPISAAVTTEKIFSGFTGEISEGKTFFYGQTFAGNPLAAACAVANLDYFESSKVLESLSDKIRIYQQALTEMIFPLSHVDEIRVSGLMTGIELTKIPGVREAYPSSELVGHKIVKEARKRGVIIRPLGNVMVLMPAIAMPEKDLIKLVQVTAESISAVCGK
jgi:adenosylmethionine---8-amino-7-oxononanoate aminotransferase